MRVDFLELISVKSCNVKRVRRDKNCGQFVESKLDEPTCKVMSYKFT